MEYFLDFDLPETLIATQPSYNRDGDRMLVFQDSHLLHDQFIHISQYLKKGDIIVFNNSKVFKARLEFSSESKHSELLLINQETSNTWTVMINKAKKFPVGSVLQFAHGINAHISDILEDGLRRIIFEQSFSPIDTEQIGQIPLPPYIIKERKKRGEHLYSSHDEERYQTLFARYYGSIAAPTASLRFSQDIIKQLQDQGVIFKEITLHVGLGTFKAIDTNPDEYKIHQEFVSVDEQTINEIHQAKKQGQRIIAAGTTVCRALESAGQSAFEGWTDIFIKPGYQFQVIDGLFTNFHLPHSTLLLLVQAFIGIEETQHIYQQALKQSYRFFSYGDGMLLLNK
ncbi:MAG: tRNA preQ1(34) S-adenosylmethionine ribosyltransferase-isomerase QueA [Brevinema sp.]